MPATVTHDAFAAALIDPAAAPPGGLTTVRGMPDEKRFAVYRNNVVAGLGKALETRFPVTSRLVGQEFFRGMARAFIGQSRPRSPLLFEYGDDFPDFIAGFEAAASVPYLADVAGLETAWTRAYHAAEATPIGADALADVPAERVTDARLEPHPSAAIIRSAWPVGSIWAAHQNEAIRPVGHARAEAVLVVRPEAEVNVHILPTKDADFAEMLLSGATLGEAATGAAASDAGFDFGAALIGLVGLGAFAAITPPEAGAGA
jgi:hypothetical protein